MNFIQHTKISRKYSLLKQPFSYVHNFNIEYRIKILN